MTKLEGFLTAAQRPKEVEYEASYNKALAALNQRVEETCLADPDYEKPKEGKLQEAVHISNYPDQELIDKFLHFKSCQVDRHGAP